ncbi:PepSY-associated TM helix domain-containing protein [Sphingobium phenoxybenzoativorans]|uniref:PepSY-associated TM helix domain-containing protein n=1 Tax=Sphingobium phenoxybenzoativorans TaxID=1592790 RepID=UPI000872835D|nr:PepSY-associated TM helix domain-containing protein [Sphingobium phenoxybenzoativorans]
MNALRKYHRWIGLVASIILIIIALTGLGLHIDQTVAMGELGRGPKLPPKPVRQPAELPDPTAAGAFITEGLQRIKLQQSGHHVLEVHVNYGGSETKGFAVLADLSAKEAKPKRIDLATGAQLPGPPELGGRWHLILQEIHAGRQFGWLGTIISILSGVSLLFLSGTGLWLYIEMYRKRLKANRRNLFWDR